jgi:hypothetical protein
MKKTLIAAGFASLMTTTAMADGIGVSMALFDDNFLTVLRNGIQSQADAAGLSVQIEDAQNDVAKQLDQINNFIASGVGRRASGVDAIIVNPVDTSATQAMSDAAAAAGVPLVYVKASRSTSTRCPTTRPSSPRTNPNPRGRALSNSATSGRRRARQKSASMSCRANCRTRPPCSARRTIPTWSTRAFARSRST